MFDVVDTSAFDHPEELKGSWMHVVFFKDHPNPNVDGIGYLYFNDKYPSGSLFVGDYILNDYPDGYLTMRKVDDETYASGRIFISPHLRKRGIATAATIYCFYLMKHGFNKKIVHLSGSEVANKAVTNASKSINFDFGTAKTEEQSYLKKELFDQPVYPYIFFGRRISI
jgi:GNAT superfamily N-acetyltransferase